MQLLDKRAFEKTDATGLGTVYEENDEFTGGSAGMDLVIASTLRSRLRGLLSSRVCAQGEVLMLVPCRSIHTFGMREPIDLAFVDSSGLILSSHRCVASARRLKDKRAILVLERRSTAGKQWLEEGQRIVIAPAPAIPIKPYL